MRLATIDDAQFLFELANDVEVRSRSFDEVPIAWDDHMAWLRAKLASRFCEILIEEGWVDGEHIGMVRLDWKPSEATEISIAVAEQYRGKGWGVKMLERVADNYFSLETKFIARVKLDNLASIKMFLDCGFWGEKEGEVWVFRK